MPDLPASPHAPHHDGSALHVSDPAPSHGDVVTVFARVPDAADVSQVWLRTTPDAEPAFVEAVADRRAGGETWFRAELALRNRVTSYRFLLDGPSGQRWLTAAGVHTGEISDISDFRLVADHGAPDWVADAILYQIYPDRFASSGIARDVPAWFDRAAWDDEPARDHRVAMRQLYGGDLPGITAHLDHLADLGVTGVYLNPIFPAPEQHRYCASSFDEVDPLLGGDAALVELAGALHGRGMRLIGDLTTNHTGSTHPWFVTARADPASAERGFYHWLDYPDEYEAWAGVPTLPKLDHRSAELRRRLYDGPESVVGRWLAPPIGLDGWRIDAANVTGRSGEVDVTREVARTIRATLDAAGGEARYLLAEHNHHAAPDLDAGGWHGTMNYLGFTLPWWTWLRAETVAGMHFGRPVPPQRQPGSGVVGAYRAINAELSWATRVASLNPLGTHDTARLRSVVGDDARFRAAVALLLTLPGVPSILYGDEVGLVGASDDLARRTMPWDRDRWDLGILGWYRDLIRLRRGHAALRRGGLRFLQASDDAVTFLRETADERLLVHVARAAGQVSLAAIPGGAGSAPEVLLDGGVGLVPEADGGARLRADAAGAGIWAL